MGGEESVPQTKIIEVKSKVNEPELNLETKPIPQISPIVPNNWFSKFPDLIIPSEKLNDSQRLLQDYYNILLSHAAKNQNKICYYIQQQSDQFQTYTEKLDKRKKQLNSNLTEIDNTLKFIQDEIKETNNLLQISIQKAELLALSIEDSSTPSFSNFS